MDDRTGQSLGPYHLLRLLDQGTLADAYLGMGIHTGNPVTIIIFHEELTSEQARQITERTRNRSSIQHPNIITLTAFGGEDRNRFLVLARNSLDPLLGRYPPGAPLPLDTIVSYVREIAAALQHLHDKGIPHQNIRPETLFVNREDGRILVMFSLDSISGLANFNDITYAPLEPRDIAADQYALASVAYEWLTGSPPFVGSQQEIAEQRQALALPSLRKRAPTLPPALETVLNKALNMDARERYTSIQQFADAFTLTAGVGPEAARLRAEARNRTTVSYASLWTEPLPARRPFSGGFGWQTHLAQCIAVAPDGRRVAFGGWDETIQVCTIAEQGESSTYRGRTGCRLRAIAWSPDGKYIAAAYRGDERNEQDQEIQIWEAASGTVLSTYRGYGAPLQWSPDEKMIACAHADRSIHIWNPFTGETIFSYQGHDGRAEVLTWSPDSTKIASWAWDQVIQVWRIGEETPICIYRGHYGMVHALAWSPDGEYIASGGDDHTVQVWNATTKEILFIYRYHAGGVRAVGWSPDGRRVRSAGRDNIFHEWNASDGQDVYTFHPPTIEQNKFRFSVFAWNADLTLLAYSHEDRSIAVADMTEEKLYVCRAPAPLVELIGQATPMTESQSELAQRNERRSRQRSSRPMQFWASKEDTRSVIYMGHSSAVKAIAWASDSSRIVTGGYNGTVQVWDATTANTIFIYRGHRDPVVSVAWSPDGKRLASGSLDNTAKIWDSVTGRELLTYRGHSDAIASVAWSPDGRSVASGSEDATVQLWDAASGEAALIYRGHSAAIETVAWSPDGRYIASGSDDRTVRVWEAATGREIYSYTGHTGSVITLAWSPDGTRIASGADWGRSVPNEDGTPVRDETPTVHIWDALTGEHAISFNRGPFPTRIYAVTWSPDGQYVAVGDVHGQVHVHDAMTGEAIAMIQDRFNANNQQRGQLLGLAWSPDGTRIATCFSHGGARIWPTHP